MFNLSFLFWFVKLKSACTSTYRIMCLCYKGQPFYTIRCTRTDNSNVQQQLTLRIRILRATCSSRHHSTLVLDTFINGPGEKKKKKKKFNWIRLTFFITMRLWWFFRFRNSRPSEIYIQKTGSSISKWRLHLYSRPQTITAFSNIS